MRRSALKVVKLISIRLRAAVFFMAALFCASQARADVIYDNGAPNLAMGWEMSNSSEADDITLTAAATFNTLRFWTLESGFAVSDALLTFGSNYGGNTPVNDLFSIPLTITSRTLTGRSAFGLDEAEYTVNLGEIRGQSGAAFYVELLANYASNTTGNYQAIYWETAGDNGTQPALRQLVGGSDWQSNDFGEGTRELAFRLEENVSPVPEPASWLMMCVGIAILLRRHRSKFSLPRMC